MSWLVAPQWTYWPKRLACRLSQLPDEGRHHDPVARQPVRQGLPIRPKILTGFANGIRRGLRQDAGLAPGLGERGLQAEHRRQFRLVRKTRRDLLVADEGLKKRSCGMRLHAEA